MKKTIRLIPLLFAVLLLLTACTATGNSQRGKELGYFNYPGLDWGMTESEFFKAIGKNADAFQMTTQDLDNLLGASIKKYTLDSIEFLGGKGDIVFGFSAKSADAVPRLSQIYVSYEDGTRFELIQENLSKLFEEQDVACNDANLVRSYIDQNDVERTIMPDDTLFQEDARSVQSVCTFTTMAMIANLPEESLKTASDGYLSLMSELGSSPDYLTFAASLPLTSATITYSAKISGTGDIEEETLTLQMLGYVADIDAYADFAE